MERTQSREKQCLIKSEGRAVGTLEYSGKDEVLAFSVLVIFEDLVFVEVRQAKLWDCV